MSRPGYWSKDGQEVPISSLESDHLKHICRYLLKKTIEFASTPSRLRYYEDKMIEIGTEAQRRDILPQGDILLDRLKQIITIWQTEWDNNGRPRAAVIPVAATPQSSDSSVMESIVLFDQVRYNQTNSYRRGSKWNVSHNKPKVKANPNERLDYQERRLDPDL